LACEHFLNERQQMQMAMSVLGGMAFFCLSIFPGKMVGLSKRQTAVGKFAVKLPLQATIQYCQIENRFGHDPRRSAVSLETQPKTYFQQLVRQA